MQKVVDEARGKGAQVVVLLSHNGMDVDLKLASRVRGIDAILGGHTHDGVPQPSMVGNAGGTTLVTNAGSNGKFLGVLDLDVKGGKVADYRYRLLPVFSNLLPADPEMAALHRARCARRTRRSSAEKLAVTEGLLYRRGNFNGTFDQLILDALMAVQGRGDRVLAGLPLGHDAAAGPGRSRCEHLMDQTAITYPVHDGERDDRRDDQDDPRGRRRQPVQSGSLLPAGRRHGAGRRPAVHDAIPRAKMGERISDMRLSGKPIDASEDLQGRRLGAGGRRRARASRSGTSCPRYLRDRKVVTPVRLNQPMIKGVAGNPGIA